MAKPERSNDIQEAIDWLKFVEDTEDEQRKHEQEELAFQRAEGAWPEDVKKQFAAVGPGTAGYTGVPIPARPMISIASLDEPISLVSAQQRNAHLAVRIHALSEDASDETATVLQGLYRNIERDSRADIARGWAYDRSLWAGRGCYRVDAVYDKYGGHPLDQKLVINRILDQSRAFFDPYAQQPDWSDGTRWMIVIPLSWKVYQQKYSKTKLAQLDDAAFDSATADSDGWLEHATGENRLVRVVEDWRVEVTSRNKVLLDDNSMAYDDEIPEGRTAKTGKEAKTLPVDERKVFWRVINYQEVIQAEQEWDGCYIPGIPVVGKELHPHQGKRGWIGMVANAKGAVRLTNYAASNAVRMAALEPRAPWIGRAGTFANNPEQWQQSNIRDFPYLEYAEVDNAGNPTVEPHRVQVDVSRLGPSMQLLTMGRDMIQTATSTYDPALGKQPTAHRSGRAIVALQDQTVQSNSPYLDNLANVSMTYEAMVILDLIPIKYDRPGRIAKILDDKNVSSWVMLNHPFQPGPNGRPQKLPYGTPDEQALTDSQVADPNHPAKFYDLTKGMYAAEVTIGKSYKDQRDEGSQEMGAILQADPAMMQIVGPEYFELRGEPWAEKVAGILKKNRDHTMPWLSDQPQGQPTPQQMQQLLADNQHLKQLMTQAAQEKQGKVVENQGKAAIVQIQETAETQRAREGNEVKLAVAELSAKVERLALFLEERNRLGVAAVDSADAAKQRQHELIAADMAHTQTLEQQQAAAAQQSDQSAQEHGQTMQQAQQASDLAPEPADTSSDSGQ